MAGLLDHIVICICTYKRPGLLLNLLEKLKIQQTGDQFTYSIVVVDNDKNRSAEQTVRQFSKTVNFPVNYLCEPEQNISLARNRAVDNASGDYIAFIDDDEFPVPDWLINFRAVCLTYKVDGVLGPVAPYFESPPPQWLLDGKICQRPSYPTGTAMHWDHMRTGNVLFKGELFKNPAHRFRAEYGRSGGEDGDFFRRVCEGGAKFVWCRQAEVYEIITADRLAVSYYLKRSMRIGGLNGEWASREPARMIRILPRNIFWIASLSLASPGIFFFKNHQRNRLWMKLAFEIGWFFGLWGRVFFRVREE